MRPFWYLIGIIMIIAGCTSSDDTPTTDITSLPSPQPCIIRLNAQSVHDTINVFATPKFDLLNPIGGMSISTNCEGDDCSPTSLPVQGILETPADTCNIEPQTCGTWYQVDWVRQGQVVVVGWISGQDEDTQLEGDCDSIPTLDPALYFD